MEVFKFMDDQNQEFDSGVTADPLTYEFLGKLTTGLAHFSDNDDED